MLNKISAIKPFSPIIHLILWFVVITLIMQMSYPLLLLILIDVSVTINYFMIYFAVSVYNKDYN